ncbi:MULTISPECIES: phytoene desaturase family protein [Paenibacillus]|uniref:phytoene desaturase family protein n=1 Tax=Paenibacillus TaxID=44249 RepID=UPI0022B8B599|nr:FAD-dependent oxidoreductase [Paenibacillus caseinilyticus]MCZ8523283.1 FAD-dependent oxidoreductase [Paenibacillus caseinilyticus]
MEKKIKYDTAVIGGGLSGLLSAVKLAQAGQKVILLEQSTRLGGRAMSMERSGALLNLGGHALYRSGEAYAMLQELGLRLPGGSPPTGGSALWQGEVVPLPGSPLRLLSTGLLSWSGKIELARLMTGLGKIDALSLPRLSLREWAEQEVKDPMVRHIFYALCRTSTYSRDLDHQPAGIALRQLQRALKGGVLYLDGGWQTIIDQLRALALKAGVTIAENRSAAAILHSEGQVRGLRLKDGETIHAPSVIATTSPASLFHLVDGAEETVLRRWKAEARPVKAACLDLALRRLPVPDRHFALGLDQPVFFSHHTRVAKLSSNGTLVVHLIKYGGPEESDPQADEELLENTMSLLHPGWQSETAARQFLPNITVVHDAVHLGQTGPYPGPDVPGLCGLYVAGDWVSHGEMLADAAAASAGRAVSRLLQDRSRIAGVPASALV